MNVKEIVSEYLKANGYDGLYTDDCGCWLTDLFPCGENFEDCKPGYEVPCGWETGNWHDDPNSKCIGPKPEKEKP